MKWLKANELTEPGTYMFGIPTICKHFFHMRKITKNDSGEFQMINENGLVIAEREVWSKNFLFFGPIPEMPVVE